MPKKADRAHFTGTEIISDVMLAAPGSFSPYLWITWAQFGSFRSLLKSFKVRFQKHLTDTKQQREKPVRSTNLCVVKTCTTTTLPPGEGGKKKEEEEEDRPENWELVETRWHQVS